MESGTYYERKHYAHIGELIKMLMEKQNISRSELQWEAKVVPSTISRWLSGKTIFGEVIEISFRTELFKIPLGTDLEAAWKKLYQQGKNRRDHKNEEAKRYRQKEALHNDVEQIKEVIDITFDEERDESEWVVTSDRVKLAEDILLQEYLSTLKEDCVECINAFAAEDTDKAHYHLEEIRKFFSYKYHDEIIDRVRILALEGNITSALILSEIYQGRILLKDFDSETHMKQLIEYSLVESAELLDGLAYMLAHIYFVSQFNLDNYSGKTQEINFLIDCTYLNSPSGFLALEILGRLCRSTSFLPPLIRLCRSQCDRLFYSSERDKEAHYRKWRRALIISKFNTPVLYEDYLQSAAEYITLRRLTIREHAVVKTKYLCEIQRWKAACRREDSYPYKSYVIACARLGDREPETVLALEWLFSNQNSSYQRESLLYLVHPFGQQRYRFLYENAIVNQHPLSDETMYFLAATANWRRVLLHIYRVGKGRKTLKRERICVYGASLRIRDRIILSRFFMAFFLFPYDVLKLLFPKRVWLLFKVIKEGGIFTSTKGKELGLSKRFIWGIRFYLANNGRIYGAGYRAGHRVGMLSRIKQEINKVRSEIEDM